jgi:hypothetical protein
MSVPEEECGGIGEVPLSPKLGMSNLDRGPSLTLALRPSSEMQLAHYSIALGDI